MASLVITASTRVIAVLSGNHQTTSYLSEIQESDHSDQSMELAIPVHIEKQFSCESPLSNDIT